MEAPVLIKRRLPSEAFICLMFNGSKRHVLVSCHKDYKGFRVAEAKYKNVKRLYLGFIEIEVTRMYKYGR